MATEEIQDNMDIGYGIDIDMQLCIRRCMIMVDDVSNNSSVPVSHRKSSTQRSGTPVILDTRL